MQKNLLPFDVHLARGIALKELIEFSFKALISKKLQWGSKYETPKIWKHLNTEHFLSGIQIALAFETQGSSMLYFFNFVPVFKPLPEYQTTLSAGIKIL